MQADCTEDMGFANIQDVMAVRLNRWVEHPSIPHQFIRDDKPIQIHDPQDPQSFTIHVDTQIEFNVELTPVAIICHSGTANRGHCFTYALHGDTWYKFNDSAVTVERNLSSLDLRHPYVVFLKKI